MAYYFQSIKIINSTDSGIKIPEKNMDNNCITKAPRVKLRLTWLHRMIPQRKQIYLYYVFIVFKKRKRFKGFCNNKREIISKIEKAAGKFQ